MRKVFASISVVLAASLLMSCTPDGTISTRMDSYATNSNMSTISNAMNDSLDGDVPQAQPPAKGEEIAVITTNMGVMKMRFFPEEAPLSVANFKALAKKGYYNGLIFHRVIKDFVIQGGDPTGTGTAGETADGKPLKDEKNTSRTHIFGAVGMAKSSLPNSGTSQFYIVVNPQGTHDLDGGYTVFGQVFDGLNIAETISGVQTDSADKPVSNVTMQKVEILPYEG